MLAKHCGFCAGVKNAVDTAMSLECSNTYVLGEIIHNSEVVRQIREKGLKTVESLDEIPDECTVVFRSHGVPENYYAICRKRNIKVVDCTCGFVKRTQKIVKENYASGKHIVIVGEPSYPEVIGLLGWCNGDATVINDVSGDLGDSVQ